MSDYPIEVMGINWQQFGLKKNPYNIRPLQEGGDAPIEKLFVGREKEQHILDRIFASDESGCLTICGKVGVGKTSLANYEKHVWKYNRPKLLFSARRELEANEGCLTKQQFILGIITSVLREIELLDPELLKNEGEFARLKNLGDIILTVESSWNLNVGIPLGYSGGVGGGKSLTPNQPLQLTDAALEGHFSKLVELLIKYPIAGRQYSGLIVHMNNFDVVMKRKGGEQKIIKFFDEVRDFLQHPNTFFIFLGPQGFFKDVISREQRVKANFSQSPILLEPLTKAELIQALRARIEAFKSEGVVRPLQPVKDEVISRFYDLYEGDVRSILSALSDILKRGGNHITTTLGIDEALALLANDRREKIAEVMTPEMERILQLFLDSPEPIRQTDIVQQLNKQATNISTYLRPLKERGVIKVVEIKGKNQYLDLSVDYACLRYFATAKKEIQTKADQANEQLSIGV